MLQLRETRIVRSKHENVLGGHIIPEEGIALVYVQEGNETKVQASTGANGEVFAGVSWSRNSAPGRVPFVQEGTVHISEKVELVRAPIAGQLSVKVSGVQKEIVNAAPANADEVQLSGLNLIFFAGEKNKAFEAQFLYEPTTTEARTIIGDGPHGGLSSTYQSVIGTLKDAVFATSYFDASADWSGVLFVKTGAGGNFVPGTANDHVANVIVKGIPNGSNPFLILSCNVA